MEKVYQAHEIEQRWYQTWEQAGYFKPSDQGSSFSMVIPPPNVTGSLHMGHGFQQTLMDALVRYHRMSGNNTLWVVGTDHAGIATQMVVERQLQAENKTRQELGRDAFVARVWDWKHTSDNMITKQIRRLGASVDWTRERFTMDDDLNHAVIEVFVRLHQDGLIYRGQRLVNWDPKFHTAISDLEVITQEEKGFLWYIQYPISNSNQKITIATTRPETMLGDMAVAVHPDDKRYQNLIGKTITLPLTQREIPIIADEFVDPEFGSGCVKITPAHDFNDYEMGMRHNLELLNIFTKDAHLNEQVPAAYQGLDRFVARQKIVDELTELGLIEKIEPHTLSIPRGDRSGEIIEPYLTQQWFVRTKPLAEPAIAAVQSGQLRFVPENWNKTYFQWLENIQDWCISRQLWWGHRIPAWYDNQGQVYVGYSEDDVRQKYALNKGIELKQDEDVLDTWFSSALWPFSTLGWPRNTEDLKNFFPTSVLITGFDIIFFWVARMVMMSLKFLNAVPFKEVYITGLIRDHDGQKMSKSKGNVLDPIDLIDGIELDALLKKRVNELMRPDLAQKITNATKKQFPNGISSYGTDALRFTYCALASTGRDIRFDMGRIEGYRNFCNKIWNAARYVLMHVEQHNVPIKIMPQELSTADRWIQSQLQHTITLVHQHFKDYRFDLLAQVIYEFMWNEYCDWYLELTKPIFNNSEASVEQKSTTLSNLLTVLETVLRLLHPIMPFITEEIWQNFAPLLNIAGKTIKLQNYPQLKNELIDKQAEEEITWLKNVVVQIRTLRSETNISPAQSITVALRKGDEQDRSRIHQYATLLSSLAKVKQFNWLEDTEKLSACVSSYAGNMEIFIPLAGLIDAQAEIARLEKSLVKLDKEKNQLTTQLSNPDYCQRAPKELIAQGRARIQEISQAQERLQRAKKSMQEVLS